MLNTRLSYLYRDASNYKQSGSVVFAGAITPTQRTQVIQALDEGSYLIVEQVGLANLREERWSHGNEDDHVWHEVTEIALTEDAPTDERTIDEFVAELVATTWDEGAATARLEEWRCATGAPSGERN